MGFFVDPFSETLYLKYIWRFIRFARYQDEMLRSYISTVASLNPDYGQTTLTVLIALSYYDLPVFDLATANNANSVD